MTLHAVWTSSGLHVWGDVSATPGDDGWPGGADAWGAQASAGHDPAAGSVSGNGRGASAAGAAVAGIADHPAACSHDALRDAVGELTGDGLLASSAQPTSLELFLPHDTRGPVVYGHDPVGPTYLAAVRVPALRFTAAQVADLLSRLGEDDYLPTRASFTRRGSDELTNPDLAGPSLSYFARLYRYVVHRIGLKQFYPDLDQIRAGMFVGVWRLLTHEPAEQERLSRFAATMPPVVRAAVERGGGAGGGRSGAEAASSLSEAADPARIVEAFLSTVADAFIRRAVSTDPFFTRVHTLASAPGAGGDVRFLSALLGSDPALRGGTPEANQLLCDEVHRWVQKLDRGRSADPWKLVFSLREPSLPDDFDEDTDATDGGDLVWRLVLQLRSPGDDGLLVDAESLWDTTIDPTGLFGRGVAERKAQLTADLQKAAEVCPLLQPLARSPTPSVLELSTLDAHAFIRNGAGDLRAAGFGVELPEWADRRERGLGLMLTVSPFDDVDADGDDDLYTDEELALVGIRKGRGRPGAAEVPSGQFGLESLLEFDWQIAVGNLRLTPEEFKALAQRGSPLVRYRGQWLQIDPDASARAGEFLARSGKGRMTLAQALRTAYGIAGEDTGLPIIGLTGKGWIDDLLSQTPAVKLGGVRQPPTFAGTLRPYQLRGLEWMCFLDRLGLGGCLADDMGLGKTVQLISLLLAERSPPVEPAAASGTDTPQAPEATGPTGPASPRAPGPTLLFAPTSVVGNWVKELQRFAPTLKVLLHHGPDRKSGDAFVEAAEASDVVITSYALAHRDIESLRRPKWHRLALDEAQKIKNPSAAATVAIRSIRAPRRIALTGTPIENHLSELWSIMELLNPGLLGSAADFRERFAVPIEKLGDKDKAQQLRRMIQPFVLRRTKNDPAVAGDLPEKMEMKVYCNLSAEQAALYERITAEMLGQIDTATGIRRRGLILAALTRLKQVCDHPVLLENDPAAPPDTASLDRRSGKCERLLEMLEEVLQEGDAALVFTQYREMGHLLERMIQDRLQTPVQFLHGGTSARQRDAMIERFQDPAGGVRIFILSLRAGGLGLNLTAANHVFHFDRWWNPAVEQQATDRAHRIGQTRKVQVHQFICVGTLEERIDKLLTDKLLLADQVVGSGDEWLTDLSTEQLRQYLSLGRDAVGDF